MGVEEQFYLIYPLLLWGLARLARNDSTPSMGRFAVVVSAMLALSAVTFVLSAQTHPVFNYYHLPTRFWELASGGLTFLAIRRSRMAMPAVVPLGAAALLGITFVLPLEQRVIATLLAVVSTAALLATTPANRRLEATLATPVLRWIGAISYPLYLWHWSVLAVSRFTIGVSVATLPVQLALMFALAWATFRYIEAPVRHGWPILSNRLVLVAALCLALACAAVPATLRLNEQIGPFRSAASNMVPAGFLPVRGSGERFEDVCLIDPPKHPRRADVVERCTVPATRPDRRMVWAFGDSHAGHLQPLLYALHDQTGMGVHVIAMANTPFPSVVETATSPEGQKTFDRVDPKIRSGDIVVLARFYLYRDGSQRAQPDVVAWTRAAADLARRLETRGVRVVIVAPPPVFRFASVLICVRNMAMSECSPTRASLAALIDGIAQEIETATRGLTNVTIFRPFDVLCPPSQTTCSPAWDGQLAFRDQDHLTVVGARALLGPFMDLLGLTRDIGERQR